MTIDPIIACLTCAKAFEHAGGNAAGWAIFMMLMVLVLVLGIIMVALVKLGRRSKKSMDPKYLDPLNDTIS